VKNLPARTKASELEAVFSPYGTLGRVLIPPSGVTALVEFLAPTEARSAFTKLAYRKVIHLRNNLGVNVKYCGNNKQLVVQLSGN